METGSLFQVAIFAVLISLSYSAPIEDEDDAGVAERKPLLEKLGMELYRDPQHHMPHKKLCYCGYGSGPPVMPPMPWPGFPPLPKPWPQPYRPVSRKGGDSSDEEE
ncbi:uncharacterized protein LOC141859862 [Acropora palmata]|uniref:uncharacterized protein LOC141859862 n=1 Tax=Acropora palmata TaxID=6131 RepID=UPI003DA174D3